MMKTLQIKYSVLLMAMLSITFAQAQSTDITNLNTKTFAPKYYLLKGESLYFDSVRIVTKEDLRINFIQTDSDTVYVRISPHQSFEVVDKTISASIFATSITKDPYLFLGNGNYAHVRYNDWDSSPLLVPIKIRPSTGDSPLQFVGEVSLGSYIGFQKGRLSLSESSSYNFSQTLGLFAAPGMIKIDPSVAHTDSSNLTLGFSMGVAYLVNFSKFQLGIVAGLDYISGDISESWIYQGKPWFSFTLGFDFNDEEKN